MSQIHVEKHLAKISMRVFSNLFTILFVYIYTSRIFQRFTVLKPKVANANLLTIAVQFATALVRIPIA